MTYEEFIDQARINVREIYKVTGYLPENDDAGGPSEWGVGPVGRHRDSEAFDVSNYEYAKRAINADDDDTCVTRRFGHFAVGWVEEIYFLVGSDAARIAYELAQRLDGYPLLDEDDAFQREYEDNHPDDGLCYDRDCDCDAEKA